MNPTSLHQIISRDNSPLKQSQVHQLFAEPTFSCFQLQDLLMNEVLMEKDQFQFFIRILKGWNSKADRTGNGQIQYRKNEFIFSWLKNLAVQSSGNIDSSLKKLFEWYASNSDQDVVCSVRKENNSKSRLQDWQIRNSYKSNMPLEINQYRRRNPMGQSSPPQASNTNTKLFKGASLAQSAVLAECKSSGHRGKNENIYIRGIRQERQMGDYLTNYRKTKVNYFKNTTKNFYRREFSKDKLSTEPFRNRVNKPVKTPQADQHIKSYRIKTSLGLRPFEKDKPNSSFSQTAYSKFHRPIQDESVQDIDSQNMTPFGSLEKDIVFAPKIDGIGLFVNPFEVKPKRKKR